MYIFHVLICIQFLNMGFFFVFEEKLYKRPEYYHERIEVVRFQGIIKNIKQN